MVIVFKNNNKLAHTKIPFRKMKLKQPISDAQIKQIKIHNEIALIKI